MDGVRKTETTDRFLSVPQTAREIGKAHATVLSLLVKGELEGEVVAGRTVITRESVERYKARASESEAATPAPADSKVLSSSESARMAAGILQSRCTTQGPE